MTDVDNNKPDAPDARLDKFDATWQRVDSCLGGTDVMRAAKETYLPQYPKENDENYNTRLNTSTFYPAYKDTLDGIVGLVFRKPPKLGDNVPQQIKDLWENIDLKGSHGDVFAQRLFRAGVHHGSAYVLVDKQRKPEERLNRAAAKQLALRPYWIRYTAKDLAQLPRYVVINGAAILQQIVFRESVTEFDGEFGTTESVSYRVWRLPVEQDDAGNWRRAGTAIWQIWREVEAVAAKGRTTTLQMIDEGDSELADIPVAVFNANPCPDDDLEFDGPVLNDLAHVAVKYWQVLSDQEKVLKRCIPVPYTVNLNAESRTAVEQAWGVDTLFHCDENGMLAFAEPAGTALEERRQHLDSIKQELRDLGLSLVIEGAKINTTATEQKLDAQTRSSKLSQMMRALQDCLEAALQHTAAWVGQESGGEITMGVKDVDLILTASDITALNTAAKDGNLSLRTMWAILQRGGWTPDDFNAEKEIEQIKEERAALPVPTVQDVPSSVAPALNGSMQQAEIK